MFRIEVTNVTQQRLADLTQALVDNEWTFTVNRETLYFKGKIATIKKDGVYVEIKQLERAYYIKGFLENVSINTYNVIDTETGEIVD